MGKATILSGGPDGSYQVRLDYGKAAQTARLAAMTARDTELVGLLAKALADLNLQEYAQAEFLIAVELAIEAYVAAAQTVPAAQQAAFAAQNENEAVSASSTATPEEKAAAAAALVVTNAAVRVAEENYTKALKDHTEALKKLAEATRKTNPLRLAWQMLKAEQVQLQKERAKWAALVLQEDVQAWCADLTEDAVGEVATVEIPGESKLVLIAPEALPPGAADGALTAREVQSPEQVFWNAAVLPGWQKFKPTYRRGTITAVNVDADTADVALDEFDRSSAQNLVINPTPTLSQVPVRYMECDASAFEVGDKCVVKFTDQDWAQPRVVGFVDNPKSCGPSLRGVPASNTQNLGAAVAKPSAAWRVRYGRPMPAQGKATSTAEMQPGHVSWSSPHFLLSDTPVELSWRGPDDRYSTISNWETNVFGDPVVIFRTGNLTTYTPSTFVWINGVMVDTGVSRLVAAALHRPDPLAPDEVVLRVCSDVYPAGSSTRGLVTYDLVPGGATAAGALDLLVKATSFSVLASYRATMFSTAANLPVVGSWIPKQRLNFDNRGARLATCIYWRNVPVNDGPPVTGAVAFDAKTWAMLAFFGPNGTEVNTKTGNTSFTYVPNSEPPLVDIVTCGYIRTDTVARQVLLAADFLDDDFVHLTLAHNFSQTRVASSVGGLTSGTEDWTDTQNTTLQVTHSKHGTLAQRTYSVSSSGSVFYDSGAGTISQSGPGLAFQWANTHVAGDLSRDAFALGFPVGAQQSISYSGGASFESGQMSAAFQATATRETVNYDVFMGGLKIADATNGSYFVPANPAGGFSANIAYNYPICLEIAASETPVNSYAVNSVALFSDLKNWSVTSPLHSHCAAHTSRSLAYFGVGMPYGLGGLELVAAREPGGVSVELKAVPPYIDGEAPTITAPVFAYRRSGSVL